MADNSGRAAHSLRSRPFGSFTCGQAACRSKRRALGECRQPVRRYRPSEREGIEKMAMLKTRPFQLPSFRAWRNWIPFGRVPVLFQGSK